MFQSARLSLTAWYLLIIMSISILFSLVIYNGINTELKRFERFQDVLQQRQQNDSLQDLPIRGRFNPAIIDEARRRLILTLGSINVGILILSGMAGYFLAGRTLKPIQEMVEEQNRFITDSSHELRTPLTALKSEIEVNLRDKNLSLKEARRLLQSNLEEVNNLQILSDSLIKLTLYQNYKSPVFANISLAKTIEEAIKKINPMAKEKNIRITNTVKDLIVVGDTQSLTELFVILLDNAVKYSPEKGKIMINALRKKDFIVTTISDTGIGVEAKDIPHLFDRFYRVDKSRTKDVPGYGLGLSIAKKIIDDHKGRVSVQSELEKGTTFSLYLPTI